MFFICLLNDERYFLSLVFCGSAPHNSDPLQIKLAIICMCVSFYGTRVITASYITDPNKQ